MSAYVTKRGIYFEKIISTIANLFVDTDTTEKLIDSELQGILTQS